MNARDVVLQRIRDAIGSGKAPASIPRDYHRSGRADRGGVIELLVDRLLDYKADVTLVSEPDLPGAVRAALGTATSIVVPAGLPGHILAACGDLAIRRDDTATPMTAAELDVTDAVITAARAACALTGTIFLDGAADQGRRAISLVPDMHLVVLRAEQVVETIPEALEHLSPTAPITMISGPSATSDIELERVEGVHGPRRLHVLIVS